MKPNSQVAKINDHVSHIRKLLGHNAILLPIDKNRKKPLWSKWEQTTLFDVRDPNFTIAYASARSGKIYRRENYHDALNDGRNIGVLLGLPSAGLVTLDMDAQAELDELLNLNPALQQTLRSCRIRGGNLWVQLTDQHYPKTTRLLRHDGSQYGEFRSTGAQTLIWGEAIDRNRGETVPTRYQIVCEARPLECSLQEIRIPHGFQLRKGPTSTTYSSESCNLNTVSLCSVSLCDTVTGDEVLANIESDRQRRKKLKQRFPGLTELYENIIEPKFQAAASHRNGFIVEAAPFIYRVVSAPLAVELLDFFYEMNRALFNDAPEQHHNEVSSMIRAVEETYLGGLNGEEARIYNSWEGPEHDAFRILRDLAMQPNPQREPMTFFMSCKQLGDRLQIDRKIASRILRRFESGYGLIKCLEKGRIWLPGEKPHASVYRWLLPSSPLQ